MISGLVLVSFVGALLAAFVRPYERARLVAIVSALLLLGLSLGIALGFDPARGWQGTELALDLGMFGERPLVAVDGVASLLVPLTALLTLSVLVSAPRAQLDRGSLVAVLASAGMLFGFISSRNAGLLAAFWIGTIGVGLVRVLSHPDRRVRRRVTRAYAIFLAGACLPILVAVVVLANEGFRAGLDAPLDLDSLAALELPLSTQWLLFGLIVATALARNAVVPFHSWMPLFVEHGPIGVTVLLIGVHAGPVLLLRLVLGLAPDACVLGMPYVTALALAAALVAALLALVQHDLKRILAFVAIAQAALVTIGVSSLEEQSLSGALLQSAGIGIGTGGMLLLVRAIEARTGTTDVRRLGGLVARAPRAAGHFFVFGLAMMGFPGTIGFIGEDLLVHGVIDENPLVAGVMLLVTALDAIAILWAFKRTFLGRPAGRSRTEGPMPIHDLLLRERAVALALAAVLIVFGLAPQPLIDARAAAVHGLLSRIHPDESVH